MSLIRILHQWNIARKQYFHGSVKFLSVNQKRVMVSLFVRLVGIYVVRHLREHKIAAATLHEGIARVAAQMFATHDFRIEFARRDVVSHSDGEVKDSGGLDGVSR